MCADGNQLTSVSIFMYTYVLQKELQFTQNLGWTVTV